MAPKLAQLLECRPEETAALGDWQNKGPDGLPLLVSQVCSLHQDQVFGVGSRSQVDGPAVVWEAIPKEELLVAMGWPKLRDSFARTANISGPHHRSFKMCGSA